MKVVELVKLLREGLKTMSECDVLRDDWRYVPLVEEYFAMRSNGLKHHAAVTVLSDDYGVSFRTVERVIKRLCKEC